MPKKGGIGFKFQLREPWVSGFLTAYHSDFCLGSTSLSLSTRCRAIELLCTSDIFAASFFRNVFENLHRQSSLGSSGVLAVAQRRVCLDQVLGAAVVLCNTNKEAAQCALVTIVLAVAAFTCHSNGLGNATKRKPCFATLTIVILPVFLPTWEQIIWTTISLQ